MSNEIPSNAEALRDETLPVNRTDVPSRVQDTIDEIASRAFLNTGNNVEDAEISTEPWPAYKPLPKDEDIREDLADK